MKRKLEQATYAKDSVAEYERFFAALDSTLRPSVVFNGGGSRSKLPLLLWRSFAFQK
jgi:hypothetical protein